MKKLVFLLFLVNVITVYSQDVVCFLNNEACTKDFGLPIDSLYVKIDTPYVWFIAKAEKQILFANNPYNSHSLITDTSDYYKSNIISSFNLKICLGDAASYQIAFFHKYDFEQNSDGGIVETSYDNGETWQNILFDTVIQNNIENPVEDFVNFYDITDTISSYDNQPGFTGLQSEYKSSHLRFTAKPYMYLDTMLLRFTIATDSVDAQNEGWMVDDCFFAGGYVALKEHWSDPELSLYPNPAQVLLLIDSYAERIIKIEIISLTGKLIYQKEGYDITAVDISGIIPGIYLVICVDNDYNYYMSKLCKTKH